MSQFDKSGVDEHAVEVARVDSIQQVDGLVEDCDGLAPREPALVEDTVDAGHFGADVLGEVLAGVGSAQS